MTRPNAVWPSRGRRVRFVGGIPSPFGNSVVNVEHEYEGELVDKPMFSDGVTWVRVHVPGIGDDVLVPLDNLR